MAFQTSATSQIAKWLHDAGTTVVFTGAGMSTESGIPDFRSPGGVWAKYSPVYYDDFLRSVASRYEYWRQKSEAHTGFTDAMPNIGHRILADWQRRDLVQCIITQNIDELHQKAGSSGVLELHGTAQKAKCLDCGASFDVDPFVQQFLQDDTVPACPECEGRLKHATISFGQSLPDAVWQKATLQSEQADLYLVIGSSLVVEPAASLPRIAKQAGVRLVILNRDKTPLDEKADLLVHASIGQTLHSIEEELKKLLDP